jgi:glycosyltransferase involved in cell wall biosynthesis
MNPLVTVIIPVFNRQALIKIALNSVIQQTYTHWECIIVDDGSSDDTLVVLESFSRKDARITYYKRERAPKGAPTCRNLGLENAKGDYIVFLDSDDYLLPFCLEQRITAFKNHSNNDFLVFPMGKQQGDSIVKVDIPNYDDYLVPFLSANLPWSIMCPIWKRSFLDQLQGFTEGYPRFNDPELMIRVLLKPEVKFLIFNNIDYDTVYIPSDKEPHVFTNKVYESLMLFIPDVVGYLELQRKSYLKKHLALYLHLWFRFIVGPTDSNNVKYSHKILAMFFNHGIISWSKWSNLKMRLVLYGITKYLLNRPINKLTERGLYI